ncbi:C5a peptidase domain protein [Streptococcus pyogenes MGAS2111]|nr:C5a peptidase domain protein [Streptococcus pyogenes MGAS2111]
MIDAGFDKNHEAWRLTDKTKARYQSKEDLEKAKKEARYYLWRVGQ